jgi:hypothetical protein
MAPEQSGIPDAGTPRPPSPWRLLAIPALAALFAFGVALALPPAPADAPGGGAVHACLGAEVTLPPGHPPIDGRAVAPGPQALLPPGHPPIGAWRPGSGPSRPAPVFQQPEILDI